MASSAPVRPDMDSRESVEYFVDAFYAKVLRDEMLAPLFLDVAKIDLEVHLPHIKNYWCKLLLQETAYKRHTMNIHRRLHGRRSLTPANFARWLALFTATVDDCFSGTYAERAKRIATSIAGNMQTALRVPANREGANA